MARAMARYPPTRPYPFGKLPFFFSLRNSNESTFLSIQRRETRHECLVGCASANASVLYTPVQVRVQIRVDGFSARPATSRASAAKITARSCVHIHTYTYEYIILAAHPPLILVQYRIRHLFVRDSNCHESGTRRAIFRKSKSMSCLCYDSLHLSRPSHRLPSRIRRYGVELKWTTDYGVVGNLVRMDGRVVGVSCVVRVSVCSGAVSLEP